MAGLSSQFSAIQFDVSGFGRRDEEGEVGKNSSGGERVYSLLYADDIVLLKEGEEKMRSIIERLYG